METPFYMPQSVSDINCETVFLRSFFNLVTILKFDFLVWYLTSCAYVGKTKHLLCKVLENAKSSSIYLSRFIKIYYIVLQSL